MLQFSLLPLLLRFLLIMYALVQLPLLLIEPTGIPFLPLALSLQLLILALKIAELLLLFFELCHLGGHCLPQFFLFAVIKALHLLISELIGEILFLLLHHLLELLHDALMLVNPHVVLIDFLLPRYQISDVTAEALRMVGYLFWIWLIKSLSCALN